MKNIGNHHGKYLAITFKVSSGIKSTQGNLDASDAPTLRIGDTTFTEEDVCSYTVGDPKDYPYRRL